jgi:hypothetical protein
MFVTVACLSFARPSSANTFLRKDSSKGQPKVLKQDIIEQRFLQEVRGITGRGPADLELPAIQAALEPMWRSLPKNGYGGLDNAQVKYALHRLFVQRHGWHIDGLGDISDKSSPAGVLKERVPGFLMELFEEAFGKTGLKLHELAVFAGTLERLIHDENIDRLKHIYKALDTATDTNMSVGEADTTMKAFVLSLILQKEMTDRRSINKGFDFLEKQYPAWGETQRWLTALRQQAVLASPDSEAVAAGNGYSIGLMENATELVSMQLGSFLDTECRSMKDALLEVEEKDSGRVLLSSFYKKGMEKGLHFVEKPAYLRELGALDESQPGEPRVIVSNFIVSPNNCLVDTGSYSVCCRNECESVMAHLESTIGASEASPEQIVTALASISASKVSSEKVLPQKVLLRLELLAERNGYKVPLYGRLFAQWLHFAFPRECPYPHISGSTNPLTSDDYQKATSEKAILRPSEMHEYISAAPAPEGHEGSDDLLQRWSDEEEVFFLPADSQRSFTGTLLGGMLVLASIAVLGVAAVDAAKRVGGIENVLGKPEKLHLV